MITPVTATVAPTLRAKAARSCIPSCHRCLAEVSSRKPHHRVMVHRTTPSSSVPCISSCIESAATNLMTGSPVGIAHVTGYSRSADKMSPCTLIEFRDSSCSGAMSSSNCVRAGSTRANCSGLDIPNRIDARGYPGVSPETVSQGLS